VLQDPAARQTYDADLKAQQGLADESLEPSALFTPGESVGVRSLQRTRSRSFPWWVYAGIIFVPTAAVGAIALVMMGNNPGKAPRDEHAAADHAAQETSRTPGHAGAATGPSKKPHASGDSDGSDSKTTRKPGSAGGTSLSSGETPPRSPFDDLKPSAGSNELPQPAGSANPNNPEKMDSKPEPTPNPVTPAERQRQIQEWAKSLKYGEEPRLIKTCQEIGKAGLEARSLGRELCRTATDRSAKVRQAAVDALQTVRPDLHPHVVVLISRDTARVKATLAAISNMGGLASDLIPIFVHDFKVAKMPKNNESYVADIAGPMACIGGNEEEIVRLIISGYSSTKVTVRSAVMTALGIVARDHRGMRKLLVPTLKTGLQDPDLNTCVAAIRASGECGAEANELLPTLRKAKLAASEMVRSSAVRAVEAIESDKPEPKPAQTADQTPPDAEKLAASKLKQAQALMDDGKPSDARDFCEEILKKYPETKAAETAKELLEKIAAKK
jgi:hypothetical protein